MKNNRQVFSLLWVLSLTVVLSACGGGGGGGNGDKSSAVSSQVTSSTPASSSRSSSSSVQQTSSSVNSSVVTSSVPASSSALSSSVSSSLLSSSSQMSVSTSSSSVGVITSVTIRYKRSAEDYTGWGLHLWGSAISTATATTWTSPRAFDSITDGWAVAVVPVTNPAVAFNLIAHKGDFKSPTADLSFVPNTNGANVWVVQDNNNLFFNETDALAAVALIGNASAALDMSDVAPMTVDSELPAGWNRSANFMQIFVRSYKDSNGDGKGDLQGLISKLDYLQSLGITGIWLMPIMESSDNDHGYSVIDYRKVETDYGSMEDFETLLTEAHARGIGVILDYVMNHSSSSNPLFVDASTAKTNSKRDWYIFSDTNPGWTSWGGAASWHSGAIGYYYGVFTSSLPDFNLENPLVVDYHMDNLRFWLNKGVDGFRFDATGVLIENGKNLWSDQPENHPLLAEAQRVINSYDNRYMICEAPDAPAQYAVSTSCINAFAFGYQSDVINTAKTNALSLRLVNLLNSPTKSSMPLILSNHDLFAGDRPIWQLNLVDHKVASAIAILASSTPFTYYGEEIGMASGNQTGDAKLRTPMSWTSNTTHAGFSTVTPYRGLSTNVATNNVAAQDGVFGSLLEHYRALYTLRKNNPVLGTGVLSLKSTTFDSHMIFTRTDGAKVAAVLINLSINAQNLSVATGVNNAVFAQKLPASNNVYTSSDSGLITVHVPEQSVVVLIH